MNLGTARIVVIVALVVVGAVVLANGFPDSGEAAAPLGTTTPSQSTSPSTPSSPSVSATQTPSPQPAADVTFMALNGTEVAGAGAAAQTTLTNHGYVSAQDATNAPSQNSD